MRAGDTAVLATNLPDDNHPYASFVLAAMDYDATPILLTSDLAEHAMKIAADNWVSLIFDYSRGLASPMIRARRSLQGRAERNYALGLRQRLLACHGDAAGYANFTDFAFYSVTVTRGHLVAGFGKIGWISRSGPLFLVAKGAGMAGRRGVAPGLRNAGL